MSVYLISHFLYLIRFGINSVCENLTKNISRTWIGDVIWQLGLAGKWLIFLQVIMASKCYDCIQVEVFWGVTPSSVAVGYRRFGGPCCLHLQGGSSKVKASQSRTPWLKSSHRRENLKYCMSWHISTSFPTFQSPSRLVQCYIIPSDATMSLNN
jgi:hypothetical protein